VTPWCGQADPGGCGGKICGRPDFPQAISWHAGTTADRGTNPQESTNLANLPADATLAGRLAAQSRAGWHGALPPGRESAASQGKGEDAACVST
jgi:hypothetical protein